MESLLYMESGLQFKKRHPSPTRHILHSSSSSLQEVQQIVQTCQELPSQTTKPSDMSSPTNTQSLSQPPTYVYLLASQDISLHGTPLTANPTATWQKEEMKIYDGKTLVENLETKKAISAEQATELRPTNVLPKGGKRNKKLDVEDPVLVDVTKGVERKQ